ncbi:MAG: glycine/betaine ABC transporter substrate-binding protein [marine bacterium B5-7]|nr:MAG: glycine/betaine ABC transporter substrate-binding protein [marine bacterium B5-7]
MKAFASIVLLAYVLMITILPVHAQDTDRCERVRFGTVGWLDAGASLAIATALLRGLGYETSHQVLSPPTIFASIKNQDLDISLDILVPTMGASLRPYIIDNSLELVRQNLHGTKYTLAVNSHGHTLGIENFSNISQQQEALSYRIYGVEPGSDGNFLIQKMIDENKFHLAQFKLVESSEADLVQRIAEANQTGKPMVFLAFEPHPMNVRFDIYYLDGGDDVFGPSFGGADAYTGLGSNFAQNCPNLALLFGNLEFSLPMINEVMTAILDLKAQPLVAAIAWMRQQPKILESWLKGVTTRDGASALPAMRTFIGLDESQ